MYGFFANYGSWTLLQKEGTGSKVDSEMNQSSVTIPSTTDIYYFCLLFQLQQFNKSYTFWTPTPKTPASRERMNEALGVGEIKPLKLK